VKHSYYAGSGKLKGSYFNVNTPVELYPYGARYLDLEVDVVCPLDKKPFLVDQENLSLLAQNGRIGADLMKKALETAEGLLAQMTGQTGKR
jgi:predicted RNA-binding protein associated with RNAse of E/G family